VRLAETVRRELAGRMTPENRDRMQLRVARSLAEVDRIVRENGTRIDRLPAPSYRAIQFLQSMEWEKLPMAAEPSPNSAPLRRFSWPGLGSFVDRAMDRLSEGTADDREAIRQLLERQSRQIESTIARQRLRADELAPGSREFRGWLALFSKPEGMVDYAAALQMARIALMPSFARQRRFPAPLRIYFTAVRGIYKLSQGPRGSLLEMPTAMIGCDEEAFALLSRLIFQRDPDAKRQLVNLMAGEDFQSMQAELDVLSGAIDTVKGLFHDLGESFKRVSAAYFADSIPQPRLVWSQSFTGRKFGHYDWVGDTLMVSRTLDRGDVPAFVVDFIMYHELLHKKHGIRWVNGRGHAHTGEFYREERLFKEYRHAEAELDRLARN
jgi:hypothetical protein